MNKEATIPIEEYAKQNNVSQSDLIGKSRKTHHAIARFVYWRMLKNAGLSIKEIGDMFFRDSSTILYGLKQIQNYIDVEDPIINNYEKYI